MLVVANTVVTNAEFPIGTNNPLKNNLVACTALTLGAFMKENVTIAGTILDPKFL